MSDLQKKASKGEKEVVRAAVTCCRGVRLWREGLWGKGDEGETQIERREGLGGGRQRGEDREGLGRREAKGLGRREAKGLGRKKARDRREERGWARKRRAH